MYLFTPCRSCLQCLPFFHDSPSSSPRHAAVAPSIIPEDAASQGTSTDPSHSIEELQCPDTGSAMQEQDPPLIGKREDAIGEKSDGLAEDNTHTHLSVVENEAAAMSGIIIAPPVSANEGAYPPANIEPNRTTVPSELPLRVPFINDISFSTSGLLPLTSPITPAAIGSGYPAGQYYQHPQIYQDQHDAPHANAHQGHDSPQGHANLHHSGHDNSHHGLDHDHSHHGHDQDHDHSHYGDAEDHGHTDFALHPCPPLDLSESGHEHHKEPSHHGHDLDHVHSHHGHAEDHGHTDFAPLDVLVSHPRPPLDLSESVHERHKDPSCHDPHHHTSDGSSTDDHEHHKDLSHHDRHHNTDGASMNDSSLPSKCESPISKDFYHDDNSPPYEPAYDSAPLPSLETSQSIPVLVDNPPHELDYDSAPLPPLETSESMPVLDGEVNLQVENGGMGMASTTNGAPAGLLQTFHSEPIALLGTQDDDDDHHDPHDEGLGHSVSHQGQRRRRRDQFKDQFKGISQQVKQGGHHMKEESSKHLQTLITNVNKQAQQLEQSGSFFNVPR